MTNRVDVLFDIVMVLREVNSVTLLVILLACQEPVLQSSHRQRYEDQSKQEVVSGKGGSPTVQYIHTGHTTRVVQTVVEVDAAVGDELDDLPSSSVEDTEPSGTVVDDLPCPPVAWGGAHGMGCAASSRTTDDSSASQNNR